CFICCRLCWEKFGWENSKADELLLPVLKEYNKREARLSWSMDERSLKDAFSSFGEVTEVKVFEKISERSSLDFHSY
uniref:RRM domain-containing protein n=1 Tax=Cucumis melo TaxID=3656 RepID=A0A9I9E477_CUCME